MTRLERMRRRARLRTGVSLVVSVSATRVAQRITLDCAHAFVSISATDISMRHGDRVVCPACEARRR